MKSLLAAAAFSVLSASAVGAQARSESPNVLIAPDEVPSGVFRLSAQSQNIIALDPELAYSPALDEHMVVWTEIIDGERYVVGQRISGSSEPLGEVVFLSESGLSAQRPVVAHDPDLERYLVTWLADGGETGHQLQSLLIDAQSGSPIGQPETLPEVRFARAPAVAYGDGGYLVVWQETDLQGASEVYSLLLDGATANAEGSPVRLSYTGADDSDPRFDAVSPSVAFDALAERYLVVWAGNGSSGEPGHFAINARGLDSAGSPDRGLLPVSGGRTPETDARWPSVAWGQDAGVFFVAWSSQGSARGKATFVVEGLEVSATTDWISEDPIRISPERQIVALHPTVGFVRDTGRYLVAWEAITKESGRQVSARTIQSELGSMGELLEIGTKKETSFSQVGNPAPSTGSGGMALVAWSGAGSGVTLQPLSLEASSSEGIELPKGVMLAAAYPNPFRTAATVTIAVRDAQRVEVVLYDMLGRRVQTVFSGDMRADEVRELTINGWSLPSGPYILEARGESFRRTVPLVRLR